LKPGGALKDSNSYLPFGCVFRCLADRSGGNV
jgi:hypothetical protein